MDYVRTATLSAGRYQPAQIPGTRISSRETRGTGLRLNEDHTRTAESDAAVISISPEGRTHARESTSSDDSRNADRARQPGPETGQTGAERNSSPKLEPELSPDEAKKVEELKRRDKEVRAREQADLASLGRYRSGGPSFRYETGPDGKRYVVSGNVPVDVSPEPTPEETIEKARTIRKSAMAPVPPSLEDFRVAFEAAQMEARARQELRQAAADGEPDADAIPIATLDSATDDRRSTSGPAGFDHTV